MNNRTTQIIVALVLLGAGYLLGTSVFPLSAQSEKTLTAATVPVHVPAHTKPVNVKEGKMSTVEVASEIVIPEDGWITAFSPSVSGAPESALRYGWLMDTSQSDPYCTSTPARVVFVMSLEKTSREIFPPGSGYFVKKGTKLRINGGFANLTDQDFAAASITASLTFVPRSSGTELTDAYPVFLNAVCNSLFILPPHARDYTKHLGHPFVIPMDGRIVLLGSHAHDFVTEILLTLNGKELWKTSAIHLPNGTNLGNPAYVAPFNGVPVKKGDILDLTEKYTNQKDTPAPAMSSMYIQILPSTSTTTVEAGGMHM